METLNQKDFPPQLLEIPQPPKKLFIRGKLPPKNAQFLSVVGSRNYTNYGKDACEKIISELRNSSLVIVSGLALGIDAIAHRAALAAGLPTIAIPGSGLDPSVLYPSSHRTLAEKIIDSGGALLSEYESTFRATPYSFPERNRLMAGISRGVLVIEAGEKSGTLITARLATEYNRDVLVVPGSIFSRNSIGVNFLLTQGATPITSGFDVLEHWGMIDTSKKQGGKIAENILQDCSKEERQILEFLTEPIARDELVAKMNLPVHELNVLLSILEIKGLVKESGGQLRLNF